MIAPFTVTEATAAPMAASGMLLRTGRPSEGLSPQASPRLDARVLNSSEDSVHMSSFTASQYTRKKRFIHYLCFL